MAIVSKSPARGRAAIPEAPTGTYEAMAAKYAQEFIRAAREQKANELSMKIIQWQNGEISYEEIKKYIEERISSAKDNSSEKVQLLQTLSSLEENQSKIKETENVQRVAQRRAELIDQFKEGGISNEEQLTIVRELREIADKDSDVYRQLIVEEAKVLGAIEAEKTKGSGQAITNTFNERVSAIESAEQRAEFAYQRGEITGQVRDQIRMQHAQELAQSVQEAMASGKSVPASALDMVQNFTFGAEQMISLREQGLMADMIDKNGMVVRIATNENNFGQEIKFSPSQGLQMGKLANIGNIREDAFTGMFYVFNPATGMETPYKSKADAMRAAEQEGLLTFDILLPDPSSQIEVENSTTGEVTIMSGARQVSMARDPNTGVFYEADNPSNAYVILPSDVRDLDNYRIGNLPPNWMSDSEIAQQVTGMVGQIRGGEENIDLNISLPQVDTTELEPEKGFFDRVKDMFTKDDLVSPLAPEDTLQEPKSFLEGLGDVAKYTYGSTPMGMSQKAADFAVGKISDLFSSPKSSAAGPDMGPTGFKTPEFNIPDFQIKDFKLPEINIPQFDVPQISTPQFDAGQFATKAREVASPIIESGTQAVKSFGSKAKDFGQRAVTGIKNFFGF